MNRSKSVNHSVSVSLQETMHLSCTYTHTNEHACVIATSIKGMAQSLVCKQYIGGIPT